MALLDVSYLEMMTGRSWDNKPYCNAISFDSYQLMLTGLAISLGVGESEMAFPGLPRFNNDQNGKPQVDVSQLARKDAPEFQGVTGDRRRCEQPQKHQRQITPGSCGQRKDMIEGAAP